MSMRKIISSMIGIFVIALLTVAPVVFAGNADKGNQQAEQTKGEKVGKGIVNILGSWTEVFASPAKGVKDHGPAGFFAGLIQMPFKIVKRAVGGATDVVTSPITDESLVDDYPCDDLSDDKS